MHDGRYPRPPQRGGWADLSRRNNARDGITGMLPYPDGNIMQMVEDRAALSRFFDEEPAPDAPGVAMRLLRGFKDTMVRF